MDKSALEVLLSTYNLYIALGTAAVVIGILGEVVVEWVYSDNRTEKCLIAVFGLLVAAGVGAELVYGRKVTETSQKIQAKADTDVEEARQAALQALPLSKVRMIATEENAEMGNSDYLRPLQKYAGINVMVEDSGEEDAPRAAREIRKNVKKMGWKVVTPIPHKEGFEFDYGVVLQWYEVGPHDVGPGGRLKDATAPSDQKNAQEAAYTLLTVLKANDWPGIAMGSQDQSLPLRYRIPHNTVRVMVGPKPGAWLSNPLVAKWKADFQQTLENAAKQKAQGAAH
jgi:hypothetical protein